MPLGLDRELKVTSQHAPLGQADAILLYSDGLYEARGDGQLFGLDRVMAAVSAPTVLPAAEIIANLRAAVLQWYTLMRAIFANRGERPACQRCVPTTRERRLDVRR